MPKAIVIGIPEGVKKRLADALKQKKVSLLKNWEFTWLISTRRSFEINIDQINKALQQVEGDGPHVLAFKPPVPAQKEWISEKVAPFFRFKWLKNGYGMPDIDGIVPTLADYLNKVLEGEQWWGETLKPSDLASPLLLPQVCFRPKPGFGDLWETAHRVEREGYPAFEKLLTNFSEAHTYSKSNQNRKWKDNRDYIYDWHGQRHGDNPYPYFWKMSYRVPNRFHYDVEALNLPKCELISADGRKHRDDHLNVDIHGYIR